MTKEKAEKVANYSAEQEAEIKAAAPLNLDKAKALAEKMGKSYRSVIAKAKSLDVPYESKPAPTKRPVQITKVELVAEISKSLSGAKLDGLEKATTAALVNLYKATKPHDRKAEEQTLALAA